MSEILDKKRDFPAERIDVLNILNQELVALIKSKEAADLMAAEKLISCAQKLVEIAQVKLAKLQPGMNDAANQIAEDLNHNAIAEAVKNGDIGVGLGLVVWLQISEPLMIDLNKYKVSSALE